MLRGWIDAPHPKRISGNKVHLWGLQRCHVPVQRKCCVPRTRTCFASLNGGRREKGMKIPGRGLLWLIFARYAPLASQSLRPVIVYSVANYRPHLNFRHPNLGTFCSCIYLILNEEHFTFHIQYKHSGTFANRKYEELSYLKKSENVRPHSRNSIENATPL